MFVATASSRVTAPSTFFVTAVLFTAVSDFESDSLVERLAAWLVAKSSEADTLWVRAEFLEELMLFVLDALEASANCEALVAEADSASCAASEDDLCVAKLSVVALFAERLLLEAAFRLASRDAALFEAVVCVAEPLPVALNDDAPLAARVLLAADPTVPEVLPPLEEVLFEVELPSVEALPPGSADAPFAVKPPLAVPLELFASFAAALRVAPSDLLEAAVKDAFVANALVVPLDLLAFAEAEADSVADALLLALAFCAKLLLLSKLFVELFVLDRSLV
jgi:hypothetical protein